MVRFIACFFACIAFISHGFAADGAARRVLPTANVNEAGTTTAARTTTTRTPIQSRTADASTAAPTTNGARTSRVTHAIESKATTTTRTPVSVTATRTSGTPTRASVSRAAGATTSAGARGALDAAVNTVGRNARVTAAGVNADPSVRRAGVSLRPSTAEVGGRAHIAGTDVQTGSNVGNNARSVSARAGVVSRESIAEARDRLEQTAELNKSCQEQYNDCMDQFCAVIDANQKRCSCSANLSQYARAESAVKNANTELNTVAQRIRYVGLSADEIRAILSATEAEEALSGQTDTSESRNMLADIEKLIVDPTAKTSTTASGDLDGLGILDIDTDFSNNSDIFNLDFLGTNSSSFSKLRGKQLFEAAKKRCNTVLTQCTDAGATAQQITGNYELAIDKDCIAYEAGLKKMNETLLSNVRSAGQMLEKARLAVRKNQNQYDAKGCVAALETCMTDDMVCGSDYRKCLDPTKKYMDENGDVVLGQDISQITESMDDYNNAFTTDELSTAYTNGVKVDENNPVKNGSNHLAYLLKKIGTKQKSTDEGLCRPVLDKCQAYTYDSNGTYQPYNDIVVNYIQRAMVNIKAAQRRIISDYASSCMVDVSACYNQQVSQVNAWSTNASTDSIYNVMRGACRNVALTCAYAVFNGDDDSCPGKTNDALNTGTAAQNTCIKNISAMFYQSMLCPDNSVFDDGGNTDNKVSLNYTTTKNNDYAWVSKMCRCNDGYYAYNGKCVLCNLDESEIDSSSRLCKKKLNEVSCDQHATKQSDGTCKCNPGYYGNGTSCTQCAAGTYAPTSGSAQCTQCWSNSHSSSDYTTCVCDDNYKLDGPGVCTHVTDKDDTSPSSCPKFSSYTPNAGSVNTNPPYITEGGYISQNCQCNGVAYDLQTVQFGFTPKPQCTSSTCGKGELYLVSVTQGQDNPPTLTECVPAAQCSETYTIDGTTVCMKKSSGGRG